VMSLLDPNRTTGNGSNDHRKVELRHQLRLSSSRHCAGKASLVEVGNGSRAFKRVAHQRSRSGTAICGLHSGGGHSACQSLRPERHQRVGQGDERQYR
jgi:hypothetical protein